jgi:hypothetical protein
VSARIRRRSGCSPGVPRRDTLGVGGLQGGPGNQANAEIGCHQLQQQIVIVDLVGHARLEAGECAEALRQDTVIGLA